MLRFDNGRTGSIVVSQVNAGRKNRLNIEIAGSKSNFEFNAEKPNELWIGKRDTANAILMKDPALVDEGARSLVSFPGGHQEGFPDTSKQLFKEVYAAIRDGKQPDAPTYPSFADGLRELIIGEAIVESNTKEAWVKI
jgi:predicted dehydrogenase